MIGPHARRGFLFYTVLFIVVVVAILAAQFHQVARHQQHTAFRFEQAEGARQIAEAAMDEGFAWLYRETANPSSDAGKWLIGGGKTPFQLPVALTKANGVGFIRSDLSLNLQALARVIDFRTTNSKGVSYDDGTGKTREGQGSLELAIAVTLRRKGFFEGGVAATCQLTRHHDFTVVTMVSPRDNAAQRNGYSQCFALDYALFVRNGLQEFRETNGLSLNQPNLKLSVFQDDLPREKRGKVFFGDTDVSRSPSGTDQLPPKANHIFLNLSAEQTNQVIPVPVAQKEFIIDQDDAFFLYPSIPANMTAKIKQQESSVRNVSFSGTKGLFTITTLPVNFETSAPDAGNEQNLALRSTFAETQAGAEANVSPGLELVSQTAATAADPDFARSICEGALRKRFWYLVTCTLDLSATQITVKGKKSGFSYSKTTGVPAAEAADFKVKYKTLCRKIAGHPPAQAWEQTFLDNLPAIDRKHGNHLPLFTRFVDDFLSSGATGDLMNPPTAETFPMPKLYNSKGRPIRAGDTGAEGLHPYNHFNFWFRQRVPPESLAALEILDPRNKTLNLRGIVHIQGSLELGESDGTPWTIKGQGVLIADNFKIKGPLRKESDSSLCVLYTRRGTIFVDTDQQVDAFLIASGDGGRCSVRPQKPLNLKGGMYVDILDSASWPAASHRIAYDPLLKSPTDHLYQINLSRWVTFQRITENEAEAK